MQNTITPHDYTVTSIKTFTGREGAGFNATLCRNGKPIAFVCDDASGGPLSFDWKDHANGFVEFEATNYMGSKYTARMTNEEKRLHDFCAAQPKVKFPETEIEYTADIFVDDLVQDVLTLRDFKRITKGKTAFVNSKGQIYSAKCEPTEANIALIRAKHPGCKILNGMSDADALAAMRPAH